MSHKMIQENKSLLQLTVPPLAIEDLKRYCLDHKLPAYRPFAADVFLKIFELVKTGEISLETENGKFKSLSWNGKKISKPKK